MSLYITTPIFYVNAQPHLGHAYSAIIADTVCRYHRLAGDTVRFQTGTDEHGEKIVEAAEQNGLSPKEYVDRISALFREAWPGLAIEPDNFIRTTDPVHIKTVQDILQKVYDQGDIYFSEYSGLYCKGCERFLTEKELVDGNCPDHQKPPAKVTEQNYFFRMSKYQQWLIDHIKANPEFITPERYKNEMLSFLAEPLEDLCISRPTSRLTWGIPLPFDGKFVTYVWFDALINYLTGIGYPYGPEFAEQWAAAEHVIAKDILKPHGIFWPTMLQAMGLPPYRKLHVHGYWNVNDTKMSKSIGNVVRPAEMVEAFGADTVRYFLLREMSFGLDASFSNEAIIARQNSDLANDLGNLFSRSLTMVGKFAANQVPRPGTNNDKDNELIDAAARMVTEFQNQMAQFAFHRALQAVWEVIGRANRYIVENAPWDLAKDPANGERLATVLYNLLESLRLIGLCIQPVMPTTAQKMAASLGVACPATFAEHGQWGGMKPGTAVTTPDALFPRLEKEKKGAPQQPQPKKEPKAKEAAKESQAAETADLIDFADFQKIDLRVAEVIAAERIKKSDRLLKLTVLAPEERTIVSGIAEHYTPEEMVGKQVIIVANLKPAKLMGTASHGMVLAAKDGKTLVLSGLSGAVPPGSKVS